MSTHLGNGSHRMIPRHRNYIWEQLAQDSLAGCFIADGFHLPDAIMKVIIRTKGRRAIVVSDSVYLAGMEAGDYDTHIGGKVTLTPEGKLHLTGSPDMLAGSAQSMAHGVDHLLRSGLAELGEVWEMGSIRPSKEMNLPGRRGLAKGAPADLVVFDREGGGMRVRETWKGGRKVFDRKRG